MKERLLFLLKVILSLLLVFVVCKLVFILVNAGEDKPSMADIISTCWHGLSLDSSPLFPSGGTNGNGCATC